MDVLVTFSAFATTVLLLHKYRKPNKTIENSQHVEKNQPQQINEAPQQPPKLPKLYSDKISIIVKQQAIPNSTKNYELEYFERSLVEKNNQYCIYFLGGCNNSIISNFLRCSNSSTDILDEHKIISNDYLPNCLFIHSTFTFPDLNLYLQFGDLCCFIITEKEDDQKIHELISNTEYRIFAGVYIYIHWNSSVKSTEQYSNYIHEIKQKYQLRDDITYPNVLFRDKRRNLHFVIADVTVKEFNELHSQILLTWKSILISLLTTRDEHQMMSFYEKVTQSNIYKSTITQSSDKYTMFIQESEIQ